ncbi:ATP-binding cassette domain-containing protein [Bradyrhizobium sp. CSA207]|uniref:ABC transporter ATP-binding protein n=1 Tax=Bradyrhizobium sp. CSA207 TaxID=2698826 RepID=UPI0023B18212|nr:ABC transporter ATP-binding protein [Bradyrhizobium sp. CSA207]MDE5445781.1 ATP-binding cassette domain-containing protein [Bradyrhizobium sp. CSA207]
MLKVDQLASGYGRIKALHQVSLEVKRGEIVALVGANGAGKTTLLKAIAGVQPVAQGRIFLDAAPIEKLLPHQRVKLGLVLVPEGRQIFAPLTVEDNLRVGAWTRADDRSDGDLERVFSYFPVLKEFRARLAGSLSGGQQQMLAVGRALMSRPKMLLLDEPSMGLAPLVFKQIISVLESIRQSGVTIFVVEQNVNAVLKIVDRAYVLEMGKITLQGTGNELLADTRVQAAYLGV